MSISNVNGALAVYQYAGKTQKTSAKETAANRKSVETGNTTETSEAEKLEAFRKEIWNEINTMPRSSSISWSINITDAAFERMMNEPAFREKMMGILRESASAGRPPITSSMAMIDESGYSGYSYNNGYGQDIFEAHTKDKDNFYVKRAAKEQDYLELWEERRLERERYREERDKEYVDKLYVNRNMLRKEQAAAAYEANR